MELVSAVSKKHEAFQGVTRELPTPMAEIGDAKVFVGDCLRLLSAVPDASIDLVITSPPYNIGEEYETTRDVDAYLDWCAEWVRELHRVVRPHGAFWLNLGYFELPGR